MDVITRLYTGLASRARMAFFRARGANLPGHARLERISIPKNARGVTLLGGAALDDGVVLLLTSDTARITIGRNCYVNRHTMLDATEEITVGDECMIGPFCYLTDHDHTFGAEVAPGFGPLLSQPTMIGARCWLGAHVTVLKGVTIGEGTVVGAGSVVTRSLPPRVIAVGNPARVLRAITA